MMSNTKSKPSNKLSEAAQVGRFGLVGILNTLVEFTLLNILAATILPSTLLIFSFTLAGKQYNITGVVLAGLISGTAAMINSFIFNKNFTFKAKKLSPTKLVLFFIITAAGLYLIRPLIFFVFTDVWIWPAQLAYSITSYLRLPFTREFDIRNTALLAAVAVVLFYNYLMYKFFIYNNEK